MLNVYEFHLGRGESGEVLSGADRAPDAHRLEPLPSPLSLYLLDLPGYGYSRASKAERAGFRGLVTHTLARPRLAGVLWLLDIRREPSADDHAMHELFAARDSRVLAARDRRPGRERELREALELDDDQMIVTSAREKEGIVELREAIGGLISGGPPRDPGLAPGVSLPPGPH